MEVWRTACALQAWRHGGTEMELWRCAVGVVTRRRGGMELWRRDGDVEA